MGADTAPHPQAPTADAPRSDAPHPDAPRSAALRRAAPARAVAARRPAANRHAGSTACALVRSLPHAAWLVSLPAARVIAANAPAAALLGRPLAELVGAPAIELAASPEDLAWWAAAAEETLPPALDSDTLFARPDGSVRPVRRSISVVAAEHAGGAAMKGADGAGTNGADGAGTEGADDTEAAAWALVMVIDRSDEHAADADREALLAELQATLESTADGLLVTDLAGGLRSFNRRFASMWGLPDELLRARDDAAIGAWMQRSVVQPEAYARQLATLLGSPLLAATDRIALLGGAVLERASRPLWRDGRPQGRVWAFRDLTERLAAEERIEALASTDTLTELPNRRVMAAWVEQAALAAARAGGTGGAGAQRAFALLVVDLDRFRQINASLGHAMGDRVLQHVARRLQGCLRETDRLARIGGDQFGVLLDGADARAAETTARRMLVAVAQPCSLEGTTFTLTCSIGIALAPAHGASADELARHAEAAMRAVKQAGRGNVRLHQARAEVDRRWHMTLDHAMRQALVSGQFRLAYQPQVDLASGCIVGAEALLRWHDPKLGEVSPGRFIPVAEESGFIVAIGDWVLAQAVRQATLWHQHGWQVPVAVNVSALQFHQAQFVERVAGVLAVSGLPPERLELELTESILVNDAEEALARLRALKRLGVHLSIDDFGTGYSSLAYLKQFPIGKLKVDRSFVRGLPGDETDAGIVRAILQMSRALGMRVIAEGVETEQQRQFLVAEGCAEMQGFLYAPALEPAAFEQRLAHAAQAAQAAPAGDSGGGSGGGSGARHIRLVSG
ncbi:MAG: EAL domain-containing protein [Rubrivivax sp.]|nr:EAL domain-containing protein [Rubrivivax sp.]